MGYVSSNQCGRSGTYYSGPGNITRRIRARHPFRFRYTARRAGWDMSESAVRKRAYPGDPDGERGVEYWGKSGPFYEAAYVLAEAEEATDLQSADWARNNDLVLQQQTWMSLQERGIFDETSAREQFRVTNPVLSFFVDLEMARGKTTRRALHDVKQKFLMMGPWKSGEWYANNEIRTLLPS